MWSFQAGGREQPSQSHFPNSQSYSPITSGLSAWTPCLWNHCTPPIASLLLTVKRPVRSEHAYVTRTCLLGPPASTAAVQRSLRTMFTNEDGLNQERTESDSAASHPLCSACYPGGRSPSWWRLGAFSSQRGVLSVSCGSGSDEWRGEPPRAQDGPRAHTHIRLLLLTWKPSWKQSLRVASDSIAGKRTDI